MTSRLGRGHHFHDVNPTGASRNHLGDVNGDHVENHHYNITFQLNYANDLATQVRQACPRSTQEFRAICTAVGGLKNAIEDVERELQSETLDPLQSDQLSALGSSCGEVLQELGTYIERYEKWGTRTQRSLEFSDVVIEERKDFMSRLDRCTEELLKFQETVGRLEQKLEKLVREIQSGLRENSIVSTKTVHMLDEDDGWLLLCRELEDIGMSRAVLIDKRQFVVGWFKDAMADGALDESAFGTGDASAEDNNFAQSRSLHRVATDSQDTHKIESANNKDPPSSQVEPAAHQKKPLSFRNKVSFFSKMIFESPSTILSDAAQWGKSEQVLHALEKGADIEWKDDDGHTPLHSAALGGQRLTTELLLDHGADIESKDKDGMTPLYWAAKLGHGPVVGLLLDRGAEIEAESEEGYTPLLIAAARGHETVFRLLLDRIANIESKSNRNGSTPLHVAALNGCDTIIKLLLDKGADIESKSNSGRTPLFEAVRGSEPETIKLLLDRGADIEAKDSIGQTPFFMAVRCGNWKTILLLRDRGADMKSVDMNGRIPLNLAHRRKRNRGSVIKLLEEASLLSSNNP